ncbi:4Fe-4S binding protein [Methanobrevibacter sp. OttesenSCG-928-K11]|nr:4Fe-4S binding protein [Methanobrevibacter sp. OttesenSCG-928-K11]MDL2270907.1 4Fe-4S binding protein [Methanobrevibacter sp. OttesenSCG-928-I08]
MRNIIRVFLEGIYGNFKKIFFKSDRVTDMELRQAILEGNVKAEKKVAENECIGCGGCANVCPTNAIEMNKLNSAEWLADGWAKTEVPVLNSEKCVACYYCHDFCPVYALFGEPGAIHPNNVGDFDVDVSELIEEPIKISDDKVEFISQYLSDKTILKNKKSK